METATDYHAQEHWNEVGAVRKLDGTACTEALGRSIVDRVGLFQGATVLDIACGTGWLAQMMAQHGAHVTAVDLSPVILRRARNRLRHVLSGNQRGSIQYVACDCAKLPFKDSFCDLAVVVKTIWVFQDIGASLREWRRLVRPGGRILVQLWGNPRNCSLITTGTMVLVDRVPSLRVHDAGIGPFDLTPQNLAAVLSTAGFGEFTATRHQMSFTVASAEEYWKLFGSVAGSAYYAYISQSANDRSQIDEAVWRATDVSRRAGRGRRLELEWWLVTGVAI